MGWRKWVRGYLLVTIGAILIMLFGILSPFFWGLIPRWAVILGIIGGIVISARGVYIIRHR